jgi:hypothetical protein
VNPGLLRRAILVKVRVNPVLYDRHRFWGEGRDALGLNLGLGRGCSGRTLWGSGGPMKGASVRQNSSL